MRSAGNFFPKTALRNKWSICISPSAYIGLCVLLLVLPLEWIAAWILVAAVHELSHLIVLKLYRIPVRFVEIRLTGARIDTAGLSLTQELLAAAAGPFSGIILAAFCRKFPVVAICAFMQTVFNLMPLKNFDGGRILRCVLCAVFPDRVARFVCLVVEIICYLFFAFGTLYICTDRKYGLFVLAAICVLLFRRFTGNTPCKHRSKIVQCIQFNIRGIRHE